MMEHQKIISVSMGPPEAALLASGIQLLLRELSAEINSLDIDDVADMLTAMAVKARAEMMLASLCEWLGFDSEQTDSFIKDAEGSCYGQD